MADYGFVYIMQNDLMSGIYKIGVTSRQVFKRAEELSSATGVAERYSPAYYLETSEAKLLESRVHKELQEYRINPAREFFRCPMRIAIDAIRNHAEDRLAEYVSDMAMEALNPGSVDHKNPLWFERHLYFEDGLCEIAKMRCPAKHYGNLVVVDVPGVE